MNLLILFEEDLIAPETARLAGRRFEHLRQILQIKQDSECRAGMLNGLTGSVRIVEITETAATMKLELKEPPPPPLPLTLICALPRPKTLRKVVQAAVTVGVKRFYFIAAWKVDKSYWTSPAANVDGLYEDVILGLEQGRDTMVPEIQFRRRFKPFVEDELPGIVGNSLGLTAHPAANESCPVLPGCPVTLCVGPEGGFTDYEVELLAAHGCRPVRLGFRPLRTEFAVAALVGRLF